MAEITLSELLVFTRDGEWGEGEPSDGLARVRVIRGTDFERVRFGDLSTLPIRYLRKDLVERKALLAGDVLIETAGGTKDQPTGRTVLIDQTAICEAGAPLVCASFARFLRPNTKLVDPAYLFWKLQAEYNSEKLLPYHIQHTGVARFQYTQFATSHRFNFPKDVGAQRDVARALSALDEKIRQNRRMNETLEEIAQVIFRDWFVDFGPVRRKLAGVTDPVEIMGGFTPDPALAAELAGLFPNELGDADLPTGWDTSTVGEVFDLTMGQSPPGETYNDAGDGLPFFQGRTDFGFRFPERRKFCSQPMRTARRDDTLISVRAPVGDLNMAWEECCIGRGVAAARHKTGAKSYTYCAMRALQPELEQFEHTGTVFGAINKKQFDRLTIVEPEKRLVAAFEALAAPLDDRLRAGVAETRTLAETRDYLLPRLMSGEVRVGEVTEVIAA